MTIVFHMSTMLLSNVCIPVSTDSYYMHQQWSVQEKITKQYVIESYFTSQQNCLIKHRQYTLLLLVPHPKNPGNSPDFYKVFILPQTLQLILVMSIGYIIC